MADEILQGWQLDQQGFYGECTLETHGLLEETFYIVTLVQRWQLPDRGAAEILAATVRLEAENNKGAAWDTWSPARIRDMNQQRREMGF